MADDGNPKEIETLLRGFQALDAEKSLSIFELLITLGKRKRLIVISIIVSSCFAAALSFLIPPMYTATAVVMPPQQQSYSLGALLGNVGGVAGLASQSLGLKNSADPYIGILKSRTVADKLIIQFGLKALYRKRHLIDTRKELIDRTTISLSKQSLIEISVQDHDPKRAADMANAYVYCLQEQSSRLAVTEASQRRLFFESQLQIERDRLAEAEMAFKKVQEQKGIYQVSSQVEAVIRSMADIRAEITAREVGLQRLKAGATRQNPEVLRQEVELRALRKQLQELEAGNTDRRQGDPLMPAAMVPEAGLEYARRLREVKYRETLFELMAKQYEAARIDEAKEAPMIQVVDHAIVPDKKTAPSRSLYIIAGMIIGSISGILIALLKDASKNPEYAEMFVSLRESLWK